MKLGKTFTALAVGAAAAIGLATTAQANDTQTLDDSVNGAVRNGSIYLDVEHKTCTKDDHILTISASTQVKSIIGGVMISPQDAESIYNSAMAPEFGEPFDKMAGNYTAAEFTKIAAGNTENIDTQPIQKFAGSLQLRVFDLLSRGLSGQFNFEPTVSKAPSPLCQ